MLWRGCLSVVEVVDYQYVCGATNVRSAKIDEDGYLFCENDATGIGLYLCLCLCPCLYLARVHVLYAAVFVSFAHMS